MSVASTRLFGFVQADCTDQPSYSIYPNTYVYYSEFEIERQYVAAGMGPKTIATSTSIFTAPYPYLDPYTADSIGPYLIPNQTSPIAFDIASDLSWQGASGMEGCVPGIIRGLPTVEIAIVTDLALWSSVHPAFVHCKSYLIKASYYPGSLKSCICLRVDFGKRYPHILDQISDQKS